MDDDDDDDNADDDECVCVWMLCKIKNYNDYASVKHLDGPG